MTNGLYCDVNGRLSVDPELFFKMVTDWQFIRGPIGLADL